VGGPGEAVVSAWKDDDAPLVHFAEATDSCVEFFCIPDFCCLLIWISECSCFMNFLAVRILFVINQREEVATCSNQPIDSWSNNMLIFLCL
jgi:hypothetical protein